MPAVAVADWFCGACGNKNFADREFCNMRKCAAPRFAAKAMMPMLAAMPAFAAKAFSPQVNNLYAFTGGKSSAKPPRQMREGDWMCPCGNANFSDRAFCNMRKCNAARPLTNWNCGVCANMNYADRTHCNMRNCNAPRADIPENVVAELLAAKGAGKGGK